MSHGGARKGAGRKPGAVTKKTREVADRLMSEGVTPLDVMLGMMRGTIEFDDDRLEAAKAAAPYCHARIIAAKVDADVKISLADLLNPYIDQSDQNDTTHR